MRFDKWFQLSEKLVRTICFKVRVQGEPVIYVINFSVWRNRGCTVAKKNTSTIWRKFFTEISVQMVSARCLVFSSSKNQEKKVKLATFHVVVVQWRQRNVQKKRDARAELLFFLIKPVAFLPFSLSSSSSSLLIKLSNVKLFCQPLKDIFSRYSSGPEEGLFC